MNPLRPDSAAICVDMGTTNTRVWLVRGTEVLARTQGNFGVRDTARDGTPARIRHGLRDLIREVQQRSADASLNAEPSHIAAAGMITSPLGLAEVPHIPAPAGLADFARCVRSYAFPDVTALPVYLVPGVRSGGPLRGAEGLDHADVMRGEETLCLGLLALNRVQPPATVLNLGSHWKAIRIDPDGRIGSSITSLSGELIYAAQTQTILASAVPHTRPTVMSAVWCQAGMAEQRRSGLARALFCVRLLELEGKSTPDERLAFLAGAFIAADLDALRRRGVLQAGSHVVIAGSEPLAEAWQRALQEGSVAVATLTDAEIEAALLAGLRSVMDTIEPGGQSN